jgi:hypothetical protein
MNSPHFACSCLLPAFAASTAISSFSSGAVTFSVTFDDQGGAWSAYYASIESNMVAAGEWWARRLEGNASLEIVVRFQADLPTANGGSVTSVFVGTSGGYNVFEQGAAGEVRTGVDANGATPDIQVTVGHAYLMNTLWFDPDPYCRIAPIPVNRTDAVSVFLHELGHAFAFNGWRHLTNGTLPGDYASTFDMLTTFDGTNFWFVGANALAEYNNAPPALTFGNIFHFGNAKGPSADLIPDLMNGVVFYHQHRYMISALDWAVLGDVNVPVRPECPADTNADAVVDVDDLIAVILSWGLCGGWTDTNGSGAVDVDDLIAVILGWGGCPLGGTRSADSQPFRLGPPPLMQSVPQAP